MKAKNEVKVPVKKNNKTVNMEESSPKVTKIDLDLTTMSDNEELMGEQQENENGESDLILMQKAPPDNLMKLRIPTTEE